jgi:membrane protein
MDIITRRRAREKATACTVHLRVLMATRPRTPLLHKGFGKELLVKAKKDQITIGAAAVAFYSMLALFPAAIFVLSILPYLPIPNLEQAIMDLVRQAMPGDAANVFTDNVKNVVHQRKAGLLSFGFLLTLWTASAGMNAVIKRLDVTYGVEETRPFWKVRGTALLLTLVVAALVLGSLSLAVFGGTIQSWAGDTFGWSDALLTVFAVLRWVVILAALMLALAVTYHYGPNVRPHADALGTRRKLRIVTPGTVAGTAALGLAALGFKLYVGNFASYDKVYGSLGAVIVLLMWLFVTGLGLLFGSEVDSLTRARASRREAAHDAGHVDLGQSSHAGGF